RAAALAVEPGLLEDVLAGPDPRPRPPGPGYRSPVVTHRSGSQTGGRGPRVLYVTANSFLRSTTSSLNAILRQLRPRGVEPVMLFREPGPWQQALAADGVPCYFDPLLVPGKDRPLGSLRDLWRLTRLVRRERIDLIHCNEH